MKIIAYSRLRGSRVHEIAEIENREDEKKGGELGRGRAAAAFHFPAFALFSLITRSYFRVPFTYTSSLLPESLEQAMKIKRLTGLTVWPQWFKWWITPST